MNEDMVILIAEDNAGHFQLIKKNLWLTCVNNDILLFKDGQEILDFLFKNGSNIHPEEKKQYVLLLDIRMPKVDGLEVLKIIKKDQRLRKIPVIMLTSVVTIYPKVNKVHEKAWSDADEYIPKPVEAGRLLQAIGALL